MKIQILSDTHNHKKINISKKADLIVHAGDFGNGLYSLYAFVDQCKALNKPYVLVLGNHDFYGTSLKEVYQRLDKDNINYLKEEKEFTFNGYTFVGGTLFSNFRSNKEEEAIVENHKFNATQYIYDFSVINHGYTYNEDMIIIPKYITPNDYHTEFNKQYNWINKYRNKDKVIVLTHFPMNLCCLTDYWRKHPTAFICNPYFINDLDIKGFKLIISGHIHSAIDTVVDDCRVVVNPLGYPKEHDLNGFNNNLILTLE